MTNPAGSDRTEPDRLDIRRRRLGITAAFFAQGLVFAAVLTHLGAFEDEWDIDDLAITVLIFSVAILAAVGSVLAGILSARSGSGTALRAGLVTIIAAVAIAALAGNFPVFCLGLVVYGVGLGLVDASTNMQAVACEALQGRSILTSFHAAWSAGGILGALSTSATSSWSLSTALLLPLVVPALAAAAPLIDRVALSGDGTDAESETPETTHLAVPWRSLTVLGMAIVLFYIADSATQSWSTIYLDDVLSATATVAPLGYAAYQATSLAARGVGDLLVRRLGPATVVRMAAGVGAAGLAMAVLAPAPLLAIIGFAVIGLGIAVVAPLTFAAAGRLADTVPGAGDPAVRRRAADAIIARVNQFNYVGFVLGGVLTGLVASGSSMRFGFLVPLVGILLILPIAHVFGRKSPHGPGVRRDSKALPS